jgi:hypothetical protein
MRRLGLWILVAVVMTACSDEPSAGVDAETTTTSPLSRGYTFGNVRCAADLFDDAIYDYSEDAVGHATIEAAIEAFREEEQWRLREDWHQLEQGDTSTSPVEFTDERGWVYLSVTLERLNETWIIGGYSSCAPPGL